VVMLKGGGGLAIDSNVLELILVSLVCGCSLGGAGWNQTGGCAVKIHTGIRHLHIRTKYAGK
jgi:hypothetical protein